MKTHTLSVFRRLLLLSALLAFAVSGPQALAVNVAEGPDFPEVNPGPATTLTLGTNTFSGTLNTPGDQQDHFAVFVPVGFRLAQVTKNFAPGGTPAVQSPRCTFNLEDLTGTGPGTFVNNFPLHTGTYSGFSGAGLCVGNAWSMTFTLEPEPDYAITTTATSITVTDNSGNGDTLDITEPNPGFIKFAAAGRKFAINNGPLLSGNSGNVSLSGVTSLTVYAGGGDNITNVSGFSNPSFPALTISGGTGNEVVNFNGNITFANNRNLSVDLQTGPNPGVDTIHVAAGVQLITYMADIRFRCSRNIVLDSGARVATGDGDLTVEANQQTTPTSGNFTGVSMNGATLEVVGTGALTVKGRGGNDPGGYQLGVDVTAGSHISGGSAGAGSKVEVVGTGGASTNFVNRGVTVYGNGAMITSGGADVTVTGTGGALSSYFGIGVSLLFGGKITSQGGPVTVTGTGDGVVGSGANQGVEMGGSGSEISSYGGDVTVIGTAGPEGSFGILAGEGVGIIAPDKNITLFADSISIDSTAGVFTGSTAGSVTIGTESTVTRLDLGGNDDNGSTPKVLGLSNAELNTILTPNLILSSASFAQLQISAPIIFATVTNLTLNADASTGSILATAPGNDIILPVGGVLKVDGPFLCPITGLAPDTGIPQLKVVGGVNLNGRALKLDGTTFPGLIGDNFVIVDNDDADPVVGTFAGLPEGSVIDWPGSAAVRAQISYVGGSGNDVTLTLVNGLLVTTSADSGSGSLREKIAAAAGYPGPNTIVIDPAIGGQVVQLLSEIAINDAATVIIDASGAPGGLVVTDTGNVNRRLFSVAPGSILTLRNFSLLNGGGANFIDGDGAAISNRGTVTLIDCTLANNTSFGPIGGGALYNSGIMSLTRCTLNGNTGRTGGAIYNDAATLTLTQCTLNGNFISGGGFIGGAIANLFGNATLKHCTVSGNSAVNQGGGIYTSNANTTLAIDNSIVAGNAPDNIFGNISSGSHNFTSGNPQLGTLASNGGPTQTMALLPGSPALDAAVVIPGLGTDQRGYARNINGDAVAGALPDIGAYEVQTAPGQVVSGLSDNTKVVAVTTAADELDPYATLGTGISLREALRDVLFSGGGIVFDPAVFNGEPADTITFAAANPGLLIDKNVTIDASNISGGVTVNAAASAANEKRVFAVNVGRTAALLGLNITGGYKIPGADQIGGGLLNHGNTTLTNCRITGNTAFFGGGIVSYSASAPTSLTVRRCTISGNVATSNGGGLINWGFTNPATLQMEDCAVTGNQANSRGGGLYSYATASATTTSTVLRTTVSGNSAASAGGCFNFSDSGSSTLSFSHCTISNNTVTGQGGGCYSDGFGDPVMTFAYTIVAGNNGPPGGSNGHDIFKQRGTITSNGGNLIGETNSSGVSWLGSDLTGTSLSPLLARLAPLDNYGGATQTMALLPTSPARNAATGSPATADQRGFPIVSGTPDIGAYEAGTLADFDAWAWETFPESATPAQHAATADLDGDGRTNLLEYGTLTSGSSPGGSSGLIVTRNAAGTLATLVMSCRFDAPDLFYTIERSTTLGTWTPAAYFNGATNIGSVFVPVQYSTDDAVSITFTDPSIAGQPKAFYRLKVMLQ